MSELSDLVAALRDVAHLHESADYADQWKRLEETADAFLAAGRPATIGVEEAGRILGLSRNGAYAAVRRGEIPVIRIGRKLLVPTHRLLALLDGADS